MVGRKRGHNRSQSADKVTIIIIARHDMSDGKVIRAGLALAIAFFSAMLGSSLATPLYPVYRDLYGFSASQIMLIFGVYAAGVLVTLMLTSKIQVRVSRYTLAIYIGLVCVSLSALIMIFANNIIALALARFMTGVGSGILMAYVNRSLLKIFNIEKSNLAAINASLALIIGQALGPIISGNALHYHFFELQSPFVFLLLTSGIAMIAIHVYGPMINQSGAITNIYSPSTDEVQALNLSMRHIFIASAALFLSWGMASTFMSQGPTIAQRFYAVNNEQQVSYCLSLFLVIAGATQILMRRKGYLSSLNIGIVGQVIALLTLLYSIISVNRVFLVLAVLLEGFAYGAILVGAAAIVNRFAVHTGKTHLINHLYIIGYIGNWLPFILSVVMDRLSLEYALIVYVILCLLIALTIMILKSKGKTRFN